MLTPKYVLLSICLAIACTELFTAATRAGLITSGGTNALLGVWGGSNSPPWHTWMGRYPDYQAGNSSMGGGGAGSNPCTANGGYPSVVNFSHINLGGPFPDAHSAARGGYNSAYRTTINNLIAPCADRIYYARIDWEWVGDWESHSPFHKAKGTELNNPVDPTTWVAGVRQLIQLLKSDPRTAHIKIEFDAPVTPQQQAYYPGDDVVDAVGTDIYFDPRTYGADSHVAWTDALTGASQTHNVTANLNVLAAFATAHNKPIIIGEWGDMYRDGYNIAQFANWIKTHNVVAQAYWDMNYGLPDGDGSALQDVAARKQAYISAFGNTHYVGTFWPILHPIPTGQF